jgi:hypothetical protein
MRLFNIVVVENERPVFESGHFRGRIDEASSLIP